MNSKTAKLIRRFSVRVLMEMGAPAYAAQDKRAHGGQKKRLMREWLAASPKERAKMREGMRSATSAS